MIFSQGLLALFGVIKDSKNLRLVLLGVFPSALAYVAWRIVLFAR